MSLSLVDDVQSALDTDRFGQSMRGFETVGSTNTEAAAWARSGAPDGAVVVTEYQSAGRGRQGRTWTADAGRNLMFSVVLRPGLDAERLGLIPIAAGVAVAEAVDTFIRPHRTTLKWPNDVLLEGRKTCGMLLESSVSGRQTANVVVLGVGLNVNQTDFPEALADTATSLRLVKGRTIPRAPLFARLLQQLERRYDAVQGGDDGSVRADFHDRFDMLGHSVTFRVSDTSNTITGVVRRVTETGALRLDTPNGPETVHAGEVTTNT